MARPGIQRDQVFVAADELLKAGQRPTIEKVRQKLKTGSPNTITPLLDEWFKELPRRIQEGRAPAANDELGTAVARNAFRLAWDTIMDEARLHVERDLASQRAQNNAERERLAGESRLLEATRGALEEAVRTAQEQATEERKMREDAQAALRRHEANAGEQMGQLHSQVAALQGQLGKVQDQLAAAHEDLQSQAREHAAERDRAEERHLENERRHLAEVDRARQNAHRMTELLAQAQTAKDELASQLTTARAAAAEQRVAFERATAETAAAANANIQRLELAVATSAQRLEGSEARASDLQAALAAERRTTEQLRQQLTVALNPPGRPRRSRIAAAKRKAPHS